MFDKLRKSTQSIPTPTTDQPPQREDVNYWTTLKSLYLASLAKKNNKKVTRRLRRQKKRSDEQVQPKQSGLRRYPVEIVGRLPPDGIPRPPSFIYNAPIRRFQIPQLRTHFYVEDPFSALPTQSFSESMQVSYYSRNSQYSQSTNVDDPFSAHLSRFFPENAQVHNSHYSHHYKPSTVHAEPIHENAFPEEPPSSSKPPPCREFIHPIESASVYLRESASHYSVHARPRRQSTSQYLFVPHKPDEDDEDISSGPVIPIAPVPAYAKHPRNPNHPPYNVSTSPTAFTYSQETLLADRLSSHAIPTQPTVAPHSEATIVDRSSYFSQASVYSQASMIPCRTSMHPRLNRVSGSTVHTIRKEVISTNEQEIDEWQDYGKEITQDDDSDSEEDCGSEDGSDSDSTYYDDDSNSIPSPSSTSSVETAFFSCDSETEDNNNACGSELPVHFAEKTVIHKARMDVLAVVQVLRETQDERTSMEIKFREDVVTGLAHVLTEVVADNKTKQRQIAPLKCRSTQAFMSLGLDDDCNMPGAFRPVPSGRGRSASTAKLL